jgi:hypothetical protein
LIYGQQFDAVLALKGGFCPAVAPGIAVGNDNGAEHGNSLLEAKVSL